MYKSRHWTSHTEIHVARQLRA